MNTVKPRRRRTGSITALYPVTMPASSNRRTRSDGYGNSAMLVACSPGRPSGGFCLAEPPVSFGRFTPGAMLWVNPCSGLVVFGFGIAALWHR